MLHPTGRQPDSVNTEDINGLYRQVGKCTLVSQQTLP